LRIKTTNPNLEIQNSKQYRKDKIQCSKQTQLELEFLDLENANFEIVSISLFGFWYF